MDYCYVDYEHRAIADLFPVSKDNFFDVDGWLLSRINVPKKHRGQGIARRLLDRILADADAQGVTLYLQIVPSGGLTATQLAAWYTRHGFLQRGELWKRNPCGRITCTT